jgi:hypothetical protein
MHPLHAALPVALYDPELQEDEVMLLRRVLVRMSQSRRKRVRRMMG